ncbi:glycosyltransferase family 2 protein [bacterium]|nr:glycosyltransferase family 2 protein [bacterium]
MYRGKRIAVVVPAYNEEVLIARTVTTMPDFIDHVVVVDDLSEDRTPDIVADLAARNPRILLIRHEVNRGVGGAISTGYVWCREHDVDIAVVMAGDGQMDPADLPNLLDPVVEDRVDYAKGNRLVTGEAWRKIPHSRYLGNSALTFLTKIASGYWHVTDSQTGYTALNRKALHLLPLEEIYPRYGMPNDFLVTCNIYNMRVVDVPVNPVYGIGEKSGIKLSKVVFSLSFLILRLFLRRMWQKYVIRDFHPLVLFYAFGFLLLLLDVPLIARMFYMWATEGRIPPINALTIVFCTFMGFQSILFAMLFDMEANRHLRGQE